MATKWMQGARNKMEKAGTVGSLRAIAQRKGILSGPKDELTAADCDKLMAAAKKSGDMKLFKKALFAKNAITKGK